MLKSSVQALRHPTFLWAVFLLLLSYFTYVHAFWNPPAFYWDENYHVASAQKYLNGTFFMEPHPPLGKLLIAAGEAILDLNAQDDQFIGTDYAQNPPSGFSLTGYRLFPVLFAWLAVPVLFALLLVITNNRLWSALFTLPYVFDNALIVHNRAAMLESTMLFSSLLTLLAFFLLLKRSGHARPSVTGGSILFGAAFAAALATKAFALLFVLLIPFLLYAFRKDMKRFIRFLWISILSFAVVYVGVWQIHFSIAETVNPALPDGGYYQASEEYKAILSAGKNDSPFAFPYMLRDSLKFVSHYEAGVPKLDLSKADENGSPWFLWPFGGRAINYRWETPDGTAYQYLYLQSNPVAWFAGLGAVAVSAALLLASVLFREIRLKRPVALLAMLTLYASFLAAVSTIDRVMYLYHYFLPLLFTFILLPIAFMEAEHIGRWKLDERRKTGILLGFACLVFLSFQFFRPLSHYVPITDEAFERRAWLDIWELSCVRCVKDSPFVERTH